MPEGEPVKGKLRLKGGVSVGVTKKKKKSAGVADGGAQQEQAAAKSIQASGKTAAQLQHEVHQAKNRAAQMKKAATKSHRDRVQEYNTKLASLTEHNDIPKVGPG